MDADLTDAPEPVLQAFFYFPAAVYVAKKPEFLDALTAVCEEALTKQREEQPELNEIYPVRMTGDLTSDPRSQPFMEYVGQTAWDILRDQGYNVENLRMSFSELWCQEHHKHSAMEQHTHGGGNQIVGFYFLNAPENASRPLFYDPKPGKVQIGLSEQNISAATYASNVVNFEPQAGMLILTNAWLPHSFTRHGSDEPVRFVHFNLAPIWAPQVCPAPCAPTAEVI